MGGAEDNTSPRPNQVTDVMDKVIDESIDNDECDDGDGKNEKSREFKNKEKFQADCNTIIFLRNF